MGRRLHQLQSTIIARKESTPFMAGVIHNKETPATKDIEVGRPAKLPFLGCSSRDESHGHTHAPGQSEPSPTSLTPRHVLVRSFVATMQSNVDLSCPPSALPIARSILSSLAVREAGCKAIMLAGGNQHLSAREWSPRKAINIPASCLHVPITTS